MLAESLRSHSPEARLTLLLNDVIPDFLDLSKEPFDAIWLPEALGYEKSWIFQHNVMELCTAVKGRALVRLMKESKANLFVYLDPDCVLYHPLERVLEYLGCASIGLVPHILAPEETDIGVEKTEMSVTEHGIFNLGHLFVRSTDIGAAFANWWAARLDRYCFDDKDRGMFTDQRWVDLVPSIFDGVKILRVPNVDVATWNLSHRTIKSSDRGAKTYDVNGYPLVTFHFSGSGPSGMNTSIREMFAAGSGSAAEIERDYEDAIEHNGQSVLGSWTSGFDFFDDGTPVPAEARKLYRRHPDLQRAFPDPFSTTIKRPTYLKWLRERRPGLVRGIRLGPDRAEHAFHELFDQAFYLEAYSDVASALRSSPGWSALDHYVTEGSTLLYDPCEFFVSSFYSERAKHHDSHTIVAGSPKGTFLWHYLTVGLPNGIEPLPYFDSSWYLNQNADVRDALVVGRVSCPLSHYFLAGAREGRAPGPSFDPKSYLEANEAARDLLAVDPSVIGALGARLRLEGHSARVAV